MALALLVPSPTWASSDAAVRWTSFSESSTCGVSYTGTPIMSTTGFLADSERILGPLGGYFGRTVGAVRSSQVWWTVPMSGGKRVLIHRSALPAFQRVAQNLATEQTNGRFYPITSVAAFVPRTINGARQISRHTFGVAVDINPGSNPFSSDPDRLISDMPDWFVDAWRDAGFCWGGDWETAKDPMHFSWMGPEPGSGEGLPLLAPVGVEAPYSDVAAYDTAWGELAGESRMLLADIGGFGALDVGALRDHPAGATLDVIPGRSGFAPCSHYRWLVPDDLSSAALVTMGDIDGDSRSDLVAVDPAGSMTVATRAGAFGDPATVPVDLPPDPVGVAVGDLSGDRIGEILVLSAAGQVVVVDDGGAVTDEFDLPRPATHLTVGDRQGDGVAELFVRFEDGVFAVLDATSLTEMDTPTLDGGPVVAIAAADEDGDGRSDLSRLAADGTIDVAVGNTSTGRPVNGWWEDPLYECDDDPIPLTWDGVFYDDDSSEFEADIEDVAGLGVTRGCNPPFRDAYCPGEPVSRGQMAAFLVRLFDLPPSSTDRFDDDDGSEFEDDINRLAAAGVTAGCTPTAYCPADTVTRGQMAAFLVRALGVTGDTSANRFSDDDQSVFEDQIELLADVGVTRGCDPPDNTRFCPEAAITRGQMAAFLGRASRIE